MNDDFSRSFGFTVGNRSDDKCDRVKSVKNSVSDSVDSGFGGLLMFVALGLYLYFL
jgi:hypothetical protein